MKNAQYWIEKLGMTQHPEGGYFKESYRSDESIRHSALPDRYEEDRTFGTSIYFLLTTDSVSKFHRLKSDEIWHYHQGSAAIIHFISPEGNYYTEHIGPDLENNQSLQVTIPRNSWFAAEVINGEYILVGCTVAPGFEFQDFELAEDSLFLKHRPDLEKNLKKFL